MPLRNKPSDLEASVEAVEEYNRLYAAYTLVDHEKTRVMNIKKAAKGIAKQQATTRINELG